MYFCKNIWYSAPLNLLYEQVIFHQKKQEPHPLVFFKNTIHFFISNLFTHSI